MGEFLFFVIGTMLGSIIGVVLMCLMQCADVPNAD